LCCLPLSAAPLALFIGREGSENRRELAAAGSMSSASNNIRRTTLEPPLSAMAAALTKILTIYNINQLINQPKAI